MGLEGRWQVDLAIPQAMDKLVQSHEISCNHSDDLLTPLEALYSKFLSRLTKPGDPASTNSSWQHRAPCTGPMFISVGGCESVGFTGDWPFTFTNVATIGIFKDCQRVMIGLTYLEVHG